MCSCSRNCKNLGRAPVNVVIRLNSAKRHLCTFIVFTKETSIEQVAGGRPDGELPTLGTLGTLGVQARCHKDQSVRLASFLQGCDESTATRGRPRVTPGNECFIVLPKSQPKSMSKPGLGAECETVGAGFATMFYGRCTKVHHLL